jgi:tetratricopeptide (TPR) repeat protein
LCWHQRKLEDAARHYARAVELGSKDERVFLDYARVLGYVNRTEHAIETLNKAVALHPESDEIHLELGASLVRNGNFGAALAQLRMVYRVQPAQAYRYFYSQAFAEYRMGDAAAAKEHAAKARTYTHNPGELASLDRLERSLNTAAPAAAIAANDESPRLVRRADPSPVEPLQPVAEPALPVIEGTLENMECGKLARLHVRTGGKLSVFVIPDPRAVSIRGGNGELVDLQCGLQNPPRAVRLGYQSIPAQPDVAGLVRSLEFR